MSKLKKIRVQHVDRNAEGVEVKTDVDVLTDADCITMDDGDLRSGVKKMIDDRIGEVIDGAPEQLDTLKEIATELEKNQSGVSTILNKLNSKLEAKDLAAYAKTSVVEDKLKYKVSVVNGKSLSANDYTNADKAKVDALDPLSSDKKLVYKQKRNTDFNNITEAGFYTVQTKANAPHNQYDYWSLIVLNSTGVDNATYVQQIAINEKVEDRAIYVRKKSNNWTSWIKLEAAPDISNLVTKIDGKGLSSNDFTNADKQKLAGIESGAQKNTVTSVNGMTGNVTIEAGNGNVDLSGYAKTTDIKTKLSEMADDSTHRTVTDEDKTNWNSKLSTVSGQDVSRTKTKGYGSASSWQSVSSSRDLEDWIGDFDKRTRENQSNMAKKSDIVDFKRCIPITRANYANLSSTEKNRADTFYYFED